MVLQSHNCYFSACDYDWHMQISTWPGVEAISIERKQATALPIEVCCTSLFTIWAF